MTWFAGVASYNLICRPLRYNGLSMEQIYLRFKAQMKQAYEANTGSI